MDVHMYLMWLVIYVRKSNYMWVSFTQISTKPHLCVVSPMSHVLSRRACLWSPTRQVFTNPASNRSAVSLNDNKMWKSASRWAHSLTGRCIMRNACVIELHFKMGFWGQNTYIFVISGLHIITGYTAHKWEYKNRCLVHLRQLIKLLQPNDFVAYISNILYWLWHFSVNIGATLCILTSERFRKTTHML